MSNFRTDIVAGFLCALYGLFLVPGVVYAQEERHCDTYRITGYVRGQGSGQTYDGTSEYTEEAIVAASWNIPIDAKVDVADLGVFRVADRGGGLAARHVDVLVDTTADARQLTGYREACWWVE